jgi:hypothetical protein
MKHTKGPWTYKANTTGLYDISPATVLTENGQEIVEEVHGFGESQQEACDQATANAQLISAAPELLEAARRALVMLNYSPMGQYSETKEQLRTAINKAEGK